MIRDFSRKTNRLIAIESSVKSRVDSHKKMAIGRDYVI